MDLRFPGFHGPILRKEKLRLSSRRIQAPGAVRHLEGERENRLPVRPTEYGKEVKTWAENYKKLKEFTKQVSDIQKQIIRLRPVESLSSSLSLRAEGKVERED